MLRLPSLVHHLFVFFLFTYLFIYLFFFLFNFWDLTTLMKLNTEMPIGRTKCGIVTLIFLQHLIISGP